jgi:hypothetical protein
VYYTLCRYGLQDVVAELVAAQDNNFYEWEGEMEGDRSAREIFRKELEKKRLIAWRAAIGGGQEQVQEQVPEQEQEQEQEQEVMNEEL